MQGRAAILDWINETMAQPINDEMRAFPVEWYVVDEERGWILCSVSNVMDDPGDGSHHAESNWTKLHYAGGGRFSYMYNPSEFAEMIKGWLAAKKASAGKG